MIIKNLPIDLLEFMLIKNLSFSDILNINSLNKYFYCILDENFYKYLAQFIYSKYFWNKAKKRNYFISKPLNSMKDELIRIEKFQNRCLKFFKRRLTNNEFYIIWEVKEKNFNKN